MAAPLLAPTVVTTKGLGIGWSALSSTASTVASTVTALSQLGVVSTVASTGEPFEGLKDHLRDGGH